ncbi:MAG TPA: hypothetical protein VIF12_02630, partial [Micavibrio sp.]
MIYILQKRAMAILAFLCILPWVWLQKDVGIAADMAWLSGAAQHVLAGRRMMDFYHDNSPPLSILIYIPVAILKAAGLPMWVAANVFSMAFIAFFTALTARMLLAVPGLGSARFWAVLGGYFISITALCQVEIGNKDHLIATALFPFILAQYCLTYKLTAAPSW